MEFELKKFTHRPKTYKASIFKKVWIEDSNENLPNRKRTMIVFAFITSCFAGVQAAYWDLLDQDRLSQVETRILIESVDCGLDDENALRDWDELRPYVRVPPWLRFLQSIRRNNPYVNALVNRLVVGSLERACALAAGYLRAHHTARWGILVSSHLPRCFAGLEKTINSHTSIPVLKIESNIGDTKRLNVRPSGINES